MYYNNINNNIDLISFIDYSGRTISVSISGMTNNQYPESKSFEWQIIPDEFLKIENIYTCSSVTYNLTVNEQNFSGSTNQIIYSDDYVKFTIPTSDFTILDKEYLTSGECKILISSDLNTKYEKIIFTNE